MKLILLLAAVLIAVYLVKRYVSRPSSDKVDEIKATVKYRYQCKDYLMTKAENDFFNIIIDSVGSQYYVFPQVHLSAVFNHKIKGQNRKAAFSYINQKSVDYIVCDKQYRKPLLGIELDDWSHDGDIRKQRDMNVEYIFREAGLPLLRFRDVKNMSFNEIKTKIDSYLPAHQNSIPDKQPENSVEHVA